MKLTPKFIKAIQKELKRAAIAIELEGGEGKFDIQGVGSDAITVIITIESHAVVSSGD